MLKLDKTVFSAYKKSEEPNDFNYWQTKTISERLKAAFYLNSIAYGFDIDNPPRMDKTIFSIKKRNG